MLSGRLTAQVGDTIVEVGPGEAVIKPRGIPHTFWNSSPDEPVRFFEVIALGGFKEYFFAIAEPLNAGDLPAMGAIMARFGLDARPETLGQLVAEHGLEPPA